MLAALVATGCTRRGPQPGPTEPDAHVVSTVPMEVQLGTPPAQTYGAAIEHALSSAEVALVEAMAGQPLDYDPALSLVARTLADTAPDRTIVPAGLVDGVMAWAGRIDVSPALVLVEVPADVGPCHEELSSPCAAAADALLEELDRHRRGMEHPVFGLGVVRLDDGVTRMLAVVVDRMVWLEPFPAVLEADELLILEGRLEGRWSGVHMEAVGSGGGWSVLPVHVDAQGRLLAMVDCGSQPEVRRVELMAHGAEGPQIVASFPLHCARELPATIETFYEVVGSAVEAEQVAELLGASLDQERTRRGLPSLTRDPALAVSARDHSLAMEREGFVGVRSPTGGSPLERLEAKGHGCSVIRTNTARGYGPRDIHGSFMRSAVGRTNVLARDVTSVGIGVATTEATARSLRVMYVTQVFCGPEQPAPSVEHQEEIATYRKGRAEWVERFLAVHSDDAGALAVLSDLQLRWEQLDDALATARRCTEVSSEAAQCWLSVGVIEEIRGNRGPAKEGYDRYLALEPDGRYAPDARKALERLEVRD